MGGKCKYSGAFLSVRNTPPTRPLDNWATHVSQPALGYYITTHQGGSQNITLLIFWGRGGGVPLIP